jgi:hypothetical protein
MTKPCPYDATTKKMEVVRIAATCFKDPKAGFTNFTASMRTTAASSTVKAVAVSGFKAADNRTNEGCLSRVIGVA